MMFAARYLAAVSAIGMMHPALTMVQAFSFSSSPSSPSSCGNVTVSWSGGTAPFYLLAIPVFGTPRNFSIPDSAFSNGKGTFSTQLKFPQKQQFLLSMSDATGFASGGSSSALQIADSSSGSCNTTDPGVAFSFQLNSALQQCRIFTFAAYTDAVQPVTIMGIVPGGTAFSLQVPKGPTSYDWTADISQGTSVMFMMIDAQGRQGGSSDIRTVGVSDDATCLNSTSPSATISPGATNSSSSSSNSSTPLGAIIGSVLGGLLVMAVIISLALFCLRRRKERRDPNNWIEASGGFTRRSRRGRSDIDIDLLADQRAPGGPQPYGAPPNATTPAPFLNSTSQYSNRVSHSIPSQSSTPHDPYDSMSHAQMLPPGTEVTPFTGQVSASTSQYSSSTRKGGSAGGPSYKPQARYILHHDADDVVPEQEEEEEVVELPPQYSERRAPQTHASTSEAGSSSAFTDRKEPFPS